MAEEMQSDNLVSTPDESQESGAVETEVKTAEDSQDGSSVESKASNLYDNKEFRAEADKIRESTKHKVSKQYEKDLAAERARIAELQSKVEQMSSPPDEESVYDQMLGDWRPRNMSVDEYQQRLQEKQQYEQQAKQQQEIYRPMEERTAKVAQAIEDFQPTMASAVQSGVLNQNMVLSAAQEDGGLEMLYGLVKENSPKLVELQKLPSHLQANEILKLTWARQNMPKEKPTEADEPVAPEVARDSGNRDYSSMNYQDGYEEWKKQRSRGR